MKLNNRGWSTTEMLLLSGGLFIALLVAIFFISKLYGSLELSTANNQYVDLENKLERAAKDYINKNNIIVTDELQISLNTLKSGNFITDLKDKDNNECNGYVKVVVINEKYYYSSFISCENYKTTNY